MTKLLKALVMLSLLWTTPSKADVTGVWTFDLDPDFAGNLWNPDTLVCTFKQEGRKLTGNCGDNAPLVGGDVDDHRVTWKLNVEDRSASHELATFTGDLDDQAKTMKGSWRLPNRTGQFEARKN